MYGGYGGYGGMYGGMYPGMMGQGMGSSYAESMWRMTQMLEMNSIMLEQLQEHVTVTFYRLRDVVEWIWALKNSSDSVKDKPPEEDAKNESKEEKDVEMSRVRRRFKALMLLLGLFMFLIFRDNRRQKKRLLDETSWLKVTQGLLPTRPDPAAMAGAMGGPMAPEIGIETCCVSFRLFWSLVRHPLVDRTYMGNSFAFFAYHVCLQ